MEDKIEVKEYVRTENNGIKKIDTIFENCTINKYGYETGESDWDGKYYRIIRTTDVIKHSKNIIDLIEKYDFVNERLVIDIDRKNNKICLLEPFDDKNLSNSFIVWHDIEDIKSILTKEQFESMKYEVR